MDRDDVAGFGLESVDPSWAQVLEPVADDVRRLDADLRDRVRLGRTYLPAPADVLRAFRRPVTEVRVLLVGQDPYPTPGHPTGLAFSVPSPVRPLPRSLTNVFRELVDDLEVPTPTSGDLSPWADAGVLLLNRVLTVAPGEPGSHRRLGWEGVTDQAVRVLAARGRPLVAILWGRDAQAVRPLLAGVPRVESVHPSPLSAARGFFGSRPFSTANALLVEQGGDPVDWRLP